jgi:hypothetical protein
MSSKSHEVIRSVGVILSLILSAVAIWFSWSTYRQSNEDVRFSVGGTREPIDLVKWTDKTGNQRYLLARRYTILIANLSTQSTSVVTMWVRDAREGANGLSTSAPVLEEGAEKPFHPILLGAGESKELEVVYREFVPKECEFAELKVAATKPKNWEQIRMIFDSRKRTFPYCDPFPERPISIRHEEIIFTIQTARGLRRVATTHELVKFDIDGRYDVTIMTPDLN